jgi:hypothetical protein
MLMKRLRGSGQDLDDMSTAAVTARLARTSQLRRLSLELRRAGERRSPMSEPIQTCVENWHRLVRGELPGGLDAILADDVVFISPIVFTPQQGKDLTKLYLNAAGATIGDGAEVSGAAKRKSKFRYIKEVVSGNNAVLEFETELEGKYVNGIDMLTCNDAGLITEFKVMIRPLQAIHLMHQQMAAMIKKLQGAASGAAAS